MLMTPIRLLARPMLASMFVAGGITSLRNSEWAAQQAKPVVDTVLPQAEALAQKMAPGITLPKDPQTWVRINSAVHILAGFTLATGRAPRLSSLALAGTLVPTTLAGHRFWEESDPAMKSNQQVHFFKNISMLGGLMLASVDTEGKPGLAWRAQRAAKDVRRETRHLGKTAKREAKLAAKSVGT